MHLEIYFLKKEICGSEKPGAPQEMMYFQTSYNGPFSYMCLPFDWPWQTSSKGLVWFGYVISKRGTDDPDSVDLERED